MDIETSRTVAYAYTLRSNCAGLPTEADYDTFFAKCSKFKIQVEYKISELDKAGRLHYHGIIYIPKGFYRKRLMVQGMSIKLKEVTNKEGWIAYIHKEVYWKDMIDHEEDFRENPLPTKKLVLV